MSILVTCEVPKAWGIHLTGLLGIAGVALLQGMSCTSLADWIFQPVCRRARGLRPDRGLLDPLCQRVVGASVPASGTGWHSLFGALMVLLGVALVTGMRFNARAFRVLQLERSTV
jgi:hypothetical protein